MAKASILDRLALFIMKGNKNMKDLIYAITTTSQSVAQNNIVPLATIKRRKGCTLQLLNNGIIARNVGYYDFKATITYTAPATGNTSFQLLKNGQPVVGVLGGDTISTADTQYITTTLVGVDRVYCGEQNAVYTILCNGVAVDITNVSLVVEYV